MLTQTKSTGVGLSGYWFLLIVCFSWFFYFSTFIGFSSWSINLAIRLFILLNERLKQNQKEEKVKREKKKKKKKLLKKNYYKLKKIKGEEKKKKIIIRETTYKYQ